MENLPSEWKKFILFKHGHSPKRWTFWMFFSANFSIWNESCSFLVEQASSCTWSLSNPCSMVSEISPTKRRPHRNLLDQNNSIFYHFKAIPIHLPNHRERSYWWFRKLWNDVWGRSLWPDWTNPNSFEILWNSCGSWSVNPQTSNISWPPPLCCRLVTGVILCLRPNTTAKPCIVKWELVDELAMSQRTKKLKKLWSSYDIHPLFLLKYTYIYICVYIYTIQY